MGPRRDSKCFARNSAGAMRPMAVAVDAISAIGHKVILPRRERSAGGGKLLVGWKDAGVNDVNDGPEAPDRAVVGVMRIDTFEPPKARFEASGVDLLVFFDVLRNSNKT